MAMSMLSTASKYVVTREMSAANTCSHDINAYACCYGEGALGSCQANEFDLFAIGGPRSHEPVILR